MLLSLFLGIRCSVVSSTSLSSAAALQVVAQKSQPTQKFAMDPSHDLCNDRRGIHDVTTSIVSRLVEWQYHDCSFNPFLRSPAIL